MTEHTIILPAPSAAQSHEQSVYAEQVRLTYKPIKLSLTGTVAGAMLVVAVQWDVVNHSVLLTWLLAMMLLTSLHGLLAYRYYRAAPDVSSAKHWGNYYIFSTALAGLMWGTGSILFFPQANFEYQLTVAFAMVVISAGGIITISFLRGAAYALIIPCMLPLIPLFILEGTYVSTILAVIILVLFIFMILSAYYFHASSNENISLRLTAVENEQKLLIAKKMIEKASQIKSEFISSMSHELRTPMNAILGFSQIIQMQSKDDKTKENIKEILNAGDHLLELINQVLDLSKIESGTEYLSIESHNLNDLLNECLSTIKPIADKRSIVIDNNVDLPPDTKINVDKSRFKQILLNLLSNAIKYNSEKGTVTMDCSLTDKKMLCLSISDTGRGLTSEQKTHIFKPFDRAGAENSNITGTGLGLVITKDLIEQMNGTIGFESEVEKGSRFWIEIPLR